MCLLHYPALFYKQSTESIHSRNQRNSSVYLSNLPNVRPVFPIFLCDLLHFRNPERSPDRDRRLRCFQARRGFGTCNCYNSYLSLLIVPSSASTRIFLVFFGSFFPVNGFFWSYIRGWVMRSERFIVIVHDGFSLFKAG